MNKFNNKKTIIILILLLLVGIVGVTIAYFSNTTSINNLFSTKEYGTTVTEKFVSPDNWLPGTTTDKKINVTNSGKVDEAVRISYTEKWVAKDGTILSGLIDSNGNLTNNTENSEHAAIINFSDNGDWNYSNGYYYYNYKLSPNNTTSTLIDSVTFNSKVKNSSNCTTTDNNGTKTITCNSTNSGYDGATYTLTFKVEIIQYDKYKEAWGVDVAIQTSGCGAYKRGDEVTYDGAKYYVLYDSDKNQNYITLLKADVLTAEEVNKYSTDYTSIDGEYPYFTNYGSDAYDNSSIKKILDNWSKKYSKDLVKIDDYKIRLLNIDDLVDSLGYEISGNATSLVSNTTENTPDWAYIDGKQYWSMPIEVGVIGISESLSGYSYYTDTKLYIRPVINIKKEAINDACITTVCNTYKKGDEITYDGSKYYVLEDSVKYEYYITLLKADFLTAEEVNEYSTDYISIDGEYPYFTNYGSYAYDNSSIKKILDNWSKKYSKDLVKIDDYKIRLLNIDDLVDSLGYEISGNVTSLVLNTTENTPDWAYISGKKYWSMPIEAGVIGISESSSSYSYYTDTKLYIRPVIYLKKSAIENECIVNGAVDYYIGDTLFYNNENYCVINDSKVSDDYVTLIKNDPLTYDELVTNKGDLSTDYFQNSNGIGLSNYYKSATCYNSDKTGCNNNYDASFVKTIINNWSNSFNNDLKEVDGYKSRLLNINELFENLGYDKEIRVTDSIYSKTDNVPSCLYNSNYIHWTMSGVDDSNFSTYIIDSSGNLRGKSGTNYTEIYEKNAIRPVINLKKCVIDNTCE